MNSRAYRPASLKESIIKAWRMAHPEAVKRWNRTYYLRHRKEIIERTTAYNKAHPIEHLKAVLKSQNKRKQKIKDNK